jgi:hypothetical protein
MYLNLSGRRVMPGVRQLPSMGQIKVFILRPDSDRFRGLYFRDEADVDVIHRFNGLPIAEWSPVGVDVDDEGPYLPEGDFPSLIGHIPVFSQRAAEALGDMLEPNGQLLPLDCGRGVYYAYNVTKLVDALDEEQSEIVRFSSGRIMDIRRYALAGEGLDEGLTIFKLSVTPLLRVFVTGRFVEAVELSGLVGFTFPPAV